MRVSNTWAGDGSAAARVGTTTIAATRARRDMAAVHRTGFLTCPTDGATAGQTYCRSLAAFSFNSLTFSSVLSGSFWTPFSHPLQQMKTGSALTMTLIGTPITPSGSPESGQYF